MKSVLLVSSADKANVLLETLLKSNGYMHISNVKTSSETRRTSMNSGYDIIVINTPLVDEVGTDLATTLANNTNAGILLIAKSENADDISRKVEEFGVVVVPKPLNRVYFHQALKLVDSTRNRLLKLETENKKLKSKIEEIRIVDRAKCILIEHLKMSESHAHRYIEKQAMDTRATRKEVALDILNTYED